MTKMKTAYLIFAFLLISTSARSNTTKLLLSCSTYEDGQTGREGYEIRIFNSSQFGRPTGYFTAKTSVVEPGGELKIATISVEQSSSQLSQSINYRGRQFSLLIQNNYSVQTKRALKAKANFVNDWRKQVQVEMYCRNHDLR